MQLTHFLSFEVVKTGKYRADFTLPVESCYLAQLNNCTAISKAVSDNNVTLI